MPANRKPGQRHGPGFSMRGWMAGFVSSLKTFVLVVLVLLNTVPAFSQSSTPQEWRQIVREQEACDRVYVLLDTYVNQLVGAIYDRDSSRNPFGTMPPDITFRATKTMTLAITNVHDRYLMKRESERVSVTTCWGDARAASLLFERFAEDVIATNRVPEIGIDGRGSVYKSARE